MAYFRELRVKSESLDDLEPSPGEHLSVVWTFRRHRHLAQHWRRLAARQPARPSIHPFARTAIVPSAHSPISGALHLWNIRNHLLRWKVYEVSANATKRYTGICQDPGSLAVEHRRETRCQNVRACTAATGKVPVQDLRSRRPETEATSGTGSIERWRKCTRT